MLQLATDLNVVQMLQPLVVDRLSKQVGQREQGGVALRHLVQAGGMLQDIPALASQLMADIERGQFGVQIHGHALERLTSGIYRLAWMVLLGLFGGAALLASLLLLGQITTTGSGALYVGSFGLVLFVCCGLLAIRLGRANCVDPTSSFY